MAEQPATLRPAQVELEILADVAAGKVADNDDHRPMLDLGGGEYSDISKIVWLMYQEPRRWVHQLDGEPLWRLTYRGRDVLQGRVPDG